MTPTDRPDALWDMFGVAKPIIGTIHLPPLPGTPRYDGQPVKQIRQRAVEDARRYAEGGVDGLIVENEGDIPFVKPDDLGPETPACMAVVTAAVIEAVGLVTGVLVLANATMHSIAVAKAAGAQFVRANQWANAYIANEGFLEGTAGQALRYRASLGGNDIKVLADVHVKHGSHAIVGDRTIAELTRDTEAFDADVLIATGERTGDPTRVDEIRAISDVATRPVLIGSGLNAGNANELLMHANGAIVGSAMKEEGAWWNPVSVDNTRQIMDVVKGLR
ncbi:BtpA/SgcQ family protein [Phycicoccus sp. Root101]|uniref:BtpA/SgcQ family protein n=1 Tax=Phycicoccus sp. Root101 TaxID=1736421 RepID=UPI0019108F50|nr:BtpA/SgcQ family protein [Phycicoccus sp. Root101]